MKVICRSCGEEWIVNAWEEVAILREISNCPVAATGAHQLRGAI